MFNCTQFQKRGYLTRNVVELSDCECKYGTFLSWNLLTVFQWYLESQNNNYMFFFVGKVIWKTHYSLLYCSSVLFIIGGLNVISGDEGRRYICCTLGADTQWSDHQCNRWVTGILFHVWLNDDNALYSPFRLVLICLMPNAQTYMSSFEVCDWIDEW